MTDSQKKLSLHEMSMTEGVRAEGDTIRDRTQNSSTDLTVVAAGAYHAGKLFGVKR